MALDRSAYTATLSSHPRMIDRTCVRVMMAGAGNDGDGDGRRRSSHFLVAAFGLQGHLNPARSLARRLAGIDGSTATLSVPIVGHRRMFPSLEDDREEVDDGVISYIPFSDGKDDGSWPSGSPEDKASRGRASVESLSAVVARLAVAGRPVTCMVCTLNMPAVIETARRHGIPLAVYWIQPATALVAYYHYFHGHGEVISSHAADPAYEVSLPSLGRPLRIRDMPSFFADKATGKEDELSRMILQGFHVLFEKLADRGSSCTTVLVNTFEALEETALAAIRRYLDPDGVFAVGPMVPPHDVGGEEDEAPIHLFRRDEQGYMEWLDAQPAKSVVYVSSGSLLACSKRQAEEILLGLRLCARPYLWVVRREDRAEEVERQLQAAEEAGGGGMVTSAAGMVVEWCDQVRVLSHPSVACFVTHCGWNSTLEAVARGVPTVAAPSWSDQPLNAHLMEEEWGVGVRAERDAEGVLPGAELARCVELVVGDGEKAARMRVNASLLRERAREAVAGGGPSERSLRSFVRRMQDLASI